jgi:Zn-dependent protease with chaperone function
MLASVVIAAMVTAEQFNPTVAISIVVVVNLLLWLLSPWITDLSLRWMNKMEFIDDTALARRYPHVHALIHEVAQDYKFAAPRVGLIADRNPTAFTYGRARGDARIIITEGIFEFLDENETRAVVAHELGHIVNRDFIVMTFAGVLVQILYQLYVGLTRDKSDSKNKLAWLGFVALVFYWIGEYLLLYLSRTREYMADAFAASRVEPQHLANALVKIAYGIAAADDTEAAADLLRSTRHLGVVDPRNARAIGVLAAGDVDVLERPAQSITAEAPAHRTITIPGAVLMFEIYNPWAKIAELNSTHPLTGKRIAAMAQLAKSRGLRQLVDVDEAAARAGLDRQSLWGLFLREACIYYLPLPVAIAVALAGFWPLAPAAFALTLLGTLLLRFPRTTPKPTTVLELMSNPRASPVFGQPVHLQGTPIGRANPGFFADEDVMLRDRTGLITVDFRSMAGFIGNFFTGWLRIGNHIGQPAEVTGWFRRDMMGFVVLREMRTPAGRLWSVPWFWQALLSGLVIAATLVIFAKIGPQKAHQPLRTVWTSSAPTK